MMTITNGTITTKVSKGAYEQFYKEQGFTVVNDKNNDDELEDNDNGKEE